MKRSQILGLLPLATIAALTPIAPAQASTACDYHLGQSATGQPMDLSLCSIRRIYKTFNVDFTYSLGAENIAARANCRSRTWMTFPEEKTHRPQSQATEDMLQILCTTPVDGDGDSAIAVIFSPPTNVRKTPNGKIICTIKEVRAIAISGGAVRTWVPINACGGYGYIHKSQLRFS